MLSVSTRVNLAQTGLLFSYTSKRGRGKSIGPWSSGLYVSVASYDDGVVEDWKWQSLDWWLFLESAFCNIEPSSVGNKMDHGSRAVDPGGRCFHSSDTDPGNFGQMPQAITHIG